MLESKRRKLTLKKPLKNTLNNHGYMEFANLTQFEWG